MKKSNLLIAFLVLGISLTSCKKDIHQCACSIYEDETVHQLADVTQKEAEEACTNLNEWYAEDGGSCSLVIPEENE